MKRKGCNALLLLLLFLLLLSASFSPAASIFGDGSRPAEGRRLTFAIKNTGKERLFLQGYRAGSERISLNLYLKDEDRWKPFHEYLPCDRPLCSLLDRPHQSCPRPEPIAIPLAPGEVREVGWDGVLYQRSEATGEGRGKYCYKPLVPRQGVLRIEVEFSRSLSEKSGLIGGRERSFIEIPLPASQEIIPIPIGR